LYSAAFFGNHFDEFSRPEIQRRPVDEVVLLLKTMGLDDIGLFPFPSLVPAQSLAFAETTLLHLGALELEKPHKPTRIGRLMSVYPLNPRLAKLIVTARQMDVLNWAVVVAAGVSVREPFDGEPTFSADRGDVLRLLTAFGAYSFAKDKVAFAKQQHLRVKAMDEIAAICDQLIRIIQKVDNVKFGTLERPTVDEELQLAQCIFTAYCDNVARRDDKGQLYMTADGKRADLPGTSALFQKKPLYVCYSEIDETVPNKPKLLFATKISPIWVAQSGSKLLLTTKQVGLPEYRAEGDSVVGRVEATFGSQNWKLPDVWLPFPDPYRTFAAVFIDGRVIPGLKQFAARATARTEELRTNRQLPPRLLMIVNSLKRVEVASKRALEAKWKAEPLFLLTEYLYWLPDRSVQSKVQCGWPFTAEVPSVVFRHSSSDESD
jgi:ATP-dependent RNA helicase DHX37/DHR1